MEVEKGKGKEREAMLLDDGRGVEGGMESWGVRGAGRGLVALIVLLVVGVPSRPERGRDVCCVLDSRVGRECGPPRLRRTSFSTAS